MSGADVHDFGEHLARIALSDDGTDTLTLTPFTRSRISHMRSEIELQIEDLNQLRNQMPESVRDTIASLLMSAKAELAGLLNDSEDGA